MTTAASPVTVQDIELEAQGLDVKRAAAIYKEHGCLVVRGLYKQYVPVLREQIEAAAKQAISLLPRATRIVEGWITPDDTLFLPAPKGWVRDKQIMVLGINYTNSAAFLQSSLDSKALDIVEAILAGRQRSSLTLGDLLEPFPVEWGEQLRQFLGNAGHTP